LKKTIQKIFRLRTDMGLNFYLIGFIYKYIFRQNRNVPWMIHHTSTVHIPEKIIRGKNVYPGDSPYNYIEASNGLTIGDYTNISPNVGIISANHDLIDNAIVLTAPPISIGKFCWIGMNAVILPGVQLGDFTIVGAGAIVSRSFPDGYCVIAGNPAKIINHLDKKACEQFAQTKYNT
jgi:acetyltransferase-like isoleucine patch superfamily enzyme